MSSLISEGSPGGEVVRLTPSMDEAKPKKKKLAKQVTWKDNDTELHVAVKAGDLEKIREILSRQRPENQQKQHESQNCDQNGEVVIDVEEDEDENKNFSYRRELIAAQNDLGETPLYVAADYGNIDAVKEFLLCCDFEVASMKTQNGVNAIHIAAKHGFLEIVTEFLNFSPDLCKTNDLSNSTPLYSAAIQGHLDVVNALLEVDKSLIKIARSNGKTALHTAARNGHLEVIKVLLKSDPDISYRIDNKGQSALHMAVKGKRTDIVEELLKANHSMINMQDKKGNTALHFATRKWRVEIVKLLLTYPEININAVNKFRETALDIAQKLPCGDSAPDIQKALREAGAKVAKDTQPPEVAKELKQTVSDIKHEVHSQLIQTAKTGRKVVGIEKEMRKLHREGINNTTNSVTVVAVLIATIAFAGIFAVPGQYYGSGDTAGQALISHKIAFQIFIIVDSVALFVSLAVVVLQITLVAWEPGAQKRVVFVINKLMWLACICTSISFISLAYIVVGPHALWSAIAVTAIGVVFMLATLATMCYFVIKHQFRDRSQRKIRRSSRSRSHSWSRNSELTDSEVCQSDIEKIYGL
eukprot:TRINITY_DN5682_c0_g1_i1.p1 TRINITY_DN5682_c0_g1~~TRINITY_DN5682_c0_g1_i1.p1  ORF type:complete len:585 (-),score=129.49 TRINITY_DN5682_c0_g1_i1:55-1809(-)